MISFDNLFSDDKAKIPNDCDIVFVSDMFVSDYSGGAELTTEALIEKSPFEVFKLHSKDVTMELLEQGFSKFWIFGNFFSINMQLIPSIVSNLKYSILEYDYKYCKYRSPEKHKEVEKVDCDCNEQMNGKMISAFYYGSTTLWWMSEKQMNRYHAIFPFLSEKNNVVLSSVFNDKTFAMVNVLKKKYEGLEKKGWLVLGSPSWIKGAQEAETWCKLNNLEYEIIWGESHEATLNRLAHSEGFAYLPLGGDTCPRMVIEAKMLGCKLHINDYVEHATEEWFTSEDSFDMFAYLYAARERFWNGIKSDMDYNPTISGYTTSLNCEEQGYPYKASIESLLGFCDEVVIVDGGSTDGTWETLKKWSETEDKLVIYQESRDWDHKRFAVFDGAQKAIARSLCTSNFCWQQDIDEIVHENDFNKIVQIINNFPPNLDLIALPVIEYWGSEEKVRADINPWKWRISRNQPYITHGIPAYLRRFDDDGELYSAMGSDGCDYVRSDNYEPIQFATFYTPDVEQVRQRAMTDSESHLSTYNEWFNKVIDSLPSVHHYSWYNIDRKIKTYKNYWTTHWQSLYNVEIEDNAETNMFFNKAWSEVTEKEIQELATMLTDKMGGWIFHKKVDFSKPTPSLKINRNHPEFITKWLEKQ